MISLADEEGVKKILIETVLGLWQTVNNLTRLRPSKRERCRATILARRGQSGGPGFTTRSSASRAS
jgi:hypothetical protein